MNRETSLKAGGSLLERAAEIYGLAEAFRAPPADESSREDEARADESEFEQVRSEVGEEAIVSAKLSPNDPHTANAEYGEVALPPQNRGNEEPLTLSDPLPRPGRCANVDRQALEAAGFIVADAPAGALAEEFRIIKRQLLHADGAGSPRDRTILVASAQPGEGKSFCALNLALSLAGERDLDVLLIDGDVAKSELPSLLGIEADMGLVDAIADRNCDPETLVIQTDIRGLSLLPAGSRRPDAPELLASARTSEILGQLTGRYPRRIVIVDSPPVLCASPATVLAAHAGQVMMVVRADRTTETDLREAVSLLSACDNISLVLNGARLLGGGSRFGTYYGYGP